MFLGLCVGVWKLLFYKSGSEYNILFKVCTVSQKRIRMACLHAVLTQRKNHHSSSVVMMGAVGIGYGGHF